MYNKPSFFFLIFFNEKIENNSDYKLSFLFLKTILKSHFGKNAKKKQETSELECLKKNVIKKKVFMIPEMNTMRAV